MKIPRTVVRKAMKRAAELGMSLRAFAERVLRDALSRPTIPRKRRIVLPTSGHGLPERIHSIAELKALENES